MKRSVLASPYHVSELSYRSCMFGFYLVIGTTAVPSHGCISWLEFVFRLPFQTGPVAEAALYIRSRLRGSKDLVRRVGCCQLGDR